IRSCRCGSFGRYWGLRRRLLALFGGHVARNRWRYALRRSRFRDCDGTKPLFELLSEDLETVFAWGQILSDELSGGIRHKTSHRYTVVANDGVRNRCSFGGLEDTTQDISADFGRHRGRRGDFNLLDRGWHGVHRVGHTKPKHIRGLGRYLFEEC